MKKVAYVILWLAWFVVVGLFVKITCDIDDFYRQMKVSDFENEKRLEEIEKDIRILKTDSYINKNGFEGGN